ncbi:MAG: hypothetical protein U0414_27040 [Polyangiaceae bacterium]
MVGRRATSVAVGIVGLSWMLAACGAAEPPRAPLIAGPPDGPIGEWTELPWSGADPTLEFNGGHVHAVGDSTYLLVADRFYRSDDHGTHWSQRGTEMLGDFAPQGPRLFGWDGNQEAPLYTSTDGGATWGGRPVATYSGDQIQSTGAFASPRFLAVLGSTAFMTQWSQANRLYISEDATRGWTGVSVPGEVQDLGARGDEIYACTSEGMFRSTDRGRVWSAIPSPDGVATPLTGCTFTRFATLLCPTVSRYSGARLYCTADGTSFRLADDGLFDVPANPDWARFEGMEYLEASAQLGSTYVLADRGSNSYAPREEGVYTTNDPFQGWTRVEALRGERVLGITQTTQAILVLSQPKTFENDRKLRLFRLRVR